MTVLGILDAFRKGPRPEMREVTKEGLLAEGAATHRFSFTGTDGKSHDAELVLSRISTADRNPGLGCLENFYDGWLEYTTSDGEPYSYPLSVMSGDSPRIGWICLSTSTCDAIEAAVMPLAAGQGIDTAGYRGGGDASLHPGGEDFFG